jgi:hypothetical protein
MAIRFFTICGSKLPSPSLEDQSVTGPTSASMGLDRVPCARYPFSAGQCISWPRSQSSPPPARSRVRSSSVGPAARPAPAGSRLARVPTPAAPPQSEPCLSVGPRRSPIVLLTAPVEQVYGGPSWDGAGRASGRATVCLLNLSVDSATAGLAGFGCLRTLLEGLDECGHARICRVGDT